MLNCDNPVDSTGDQNNACGSHTSTFFDPFQIFEVNAQRCHIVQVQILRGRDKPKGWVFSLFHTPDLYVMLHVPKTPNGYKRTRTVENCPSPVWNETFTFLLDPDESYVLKMYLMDANLLRNDTKVGEAAIDLTDLPIDEEVEQEVNFPKGSTAWIKLLRKEDSKPDLRFSLALSQEEKDFLARRRAHILDAMRKFLGSDYGPNDVAEVPCVGVLGSGGGFRALVGLSGAMKALHESGAFDCITYLASLSGGSWYISYLFSQAEFQTKGPSAYHDQLRETICQNNWLKLLTPVGVFRYISAILKKSKTGQPVSLTDFFGHLVGESVLGKEGKNCKLSDQALKLESGDVPLPLYTCINVKKNVSARVYQEWIEFSPYEIGFAKYGTFMKPSHFGCKFFMGKMVKQFEEPPLHYLQGLWGSAYCILFKRIIKERWRKDFPEMKIGLVDEELDDEMSEEETVKLWGCCSSSDELSDTATSSADTDRDESLNDSDRLRDTDSFESSFVRLLEKQHQSIESRLPAPPGRYEMEHSSSHKLRQVTFQDGTPSTSKDETSPQLVTQDTTDEQKGTMHKCAPFTSVETIPSNSPDKIAAAVMQEPSLDQQESQASYWRRKLEALFDTNIMNNRAGRAGLIFNPLRGLNLSETYPISPFTPTTPEDEDDFKGNFEPVEVQAKQLFLVDSGLTFNLPFPLLLRPQRAVDIYLTYDFSTRSSDNVSPFREILHVEKWALLNKVPFPPIQEQVNDFLLEPLRECYVFESSKDPYCPVIIHFILLNDKFRVYKSPGARRKTEEEKQFANFDIFSDPKDSYSLYNFAYTQQQFDRLSALMEFNTLHSLPVIRAQMARVVARRRHLPPKPPVKLSHIPLMRLKSTPKSLQRLHEYVKSISMMHVTGQEQSVNEEIAEEETQLDEFYYEKIQEHYCHKGGLTKSSSPEPSINKEDGWK